MSQSEDPADQHSIGESADGSFAPPASATARENATIPSEQISRWALHRRLYNWVLSFAHHRHSTTALFVISFAESSFFPIPPDVLLAPVCLGNRRRALWFATVTTLASVAGAFLGYAIGWWAIELALLIPGITQEGIDKLKLEFNVRGQWYVFIAAFTPIPFKLLTITSGVAKMKLVVFALACLVGRAGRFFAVAGVIWWVGPKAMPLIDRYFNWLCVAFVVLLIGGFAVIKIMH